MHVFVLIHGLLGTPSHMAYIKKTLEEAVLRQAAVDTASTASNRHRLSPDDLSILVPACNASWLTYDGIDVLSRRVLIELEQHLDFLPRKATQISLVGYSLGGLVARHLAGQLLKLGFFDERGIEPVNFVTLATPHLGIRYPSTVSFRSRMLTHFASAGYASRSGVQLVFDDTYGDTNLPLLQVMTTPGSIYMDALSQFKNLSIYANAINDRTVPFWTAFLLSDEEGKGGGFMVDDVLDRELILVPGYQNSVVESFGTPVDVWTVKAKQTKKLEATGKANSTRSLTPRPNSRESARDAVVETASNTPPPPNLHTSTPLPLLRRGIFLAMLPIIAVVAASVTTYQSWSSKSRIKQETANATVAGARGFSTLARRNSLHLAVSPAEEEDERKRVLEDMEVATKEEESMAPTAAEEDQVSTTTTAGAIDDTKLGEVEKLEILESQHRVEELLAQKSTGGEKRPPSSNGTTGGASSYKTAPSPVSTTKRHQTAPTFLPPILTTTHPELSQMLPIQLTMSNNLNSLPWTKYTVRIPHYRSHACIVARSPGEFEEMGKGVVEHLVNVGLRW